MINGLGITMNIRINKLTKPIFIMMSTMITKFKLRTLKDKPQRDQIFLDPLKNKSVFLEILNYNSPKLLIKANLLNNKKLN